MESAADLSFDVCRLSKDSVLSSDQISGSHDDPQTICGRFLIRCGDLG